RNGKKKSREKANARKKRRRELMRNVGRDELMEKIGSVYKLCNLAAMRAMELNNGMKKLVDADPREKVTTIAIKEIAADKVKIKEAKKSK
ncbi:MAG: DNA-directed RNA polymerase subunit omega, partial [Candidatus Omnitrophota bacterium]